MFSVGALRFAIAASAVDEIRNLDGLVPHACGPQSRTAKVQFTLVRKKKSINTNYVVSSALHFGIESSPPSRVLVLRNHPVALLVDNIDRMRQIGQVLPMPHAFRGIERQWYRGLTIVDGMVIPVIEPTSILREAELDALSEAKIKAVAV